MTPPFKFQVTDVFDIRDRQGLAVVGIVQAGAVRVGTVLRDDATGHSFELIGIDLLCSR